MNVSVNDMVVKAAGKALRMVPEVNGYWNTKTGAVDLRDTVDVSVAVATDGGLITPIVKNADLYVLLPCCRGLSHEGGNFLVDTRLLYCSVGRVGWGLDVCRFSCWVGAGCMSL